MAARPGDPKGHLALGAAYFASMDYDKCRAEMAGIAKDPKTEAGAAYYLGRVGRMEENYDEALGYLERAIKLVPSFAEAYTELARVRIGQGRLAAARTAVDRALALDPDSFLANSALLSVLQLTIWAPNNRPRACERWMPSGRAAVNWRELLTGRVEVDECYLGGLEEGLPGRLNLKKTLVVVAAQEDGPGIGGIRMRQLSDASAESLMPFVRDSAEPGKIRDSGEGDLAIRTLYNGRTVHGVQFLSPVRRRTPTAYYGFRSGIGLLLEGSEISNRRVAIIGLGVGTLAAYGRKGDFFRFYEINPAVIQAASANFHFLADSAAAIDVVNGDGRLRLEQEPSQNFDLIVLDAFSDDAIPVHLLTREAFQAYFARLRCGSALAVHVTNSYLDLNPVVESLAGALGKGVVRIHSPADPRLQTFAADWVVVSDRSATTEKLQSYADPARLKRGPLWTDEYSNLFQVWR